MESLLRSKRTPRALRAAGFTLVELLVVLAIICVVIAVVFTSQSSFSNSLLLSNTAYDIALSLNGAQTYGLGTRGVSATGASNAGYGLSFKKANKNSYVFFADSHPGASAAYCHGLPANGNKAPNAYPGDCRYNAGNDVTVSTYTINNKITISNLCAYNGATWSCSVSCGAEAANGCTTDLTQLDIIFLRPNTRVFITRNASYSAAPALTRACVQVSSPNGSTRTLEVAFTGQVIANTTSCP